MNRQIDLEITRAIRRVFARHWIDLGLLRIRTVNCNVTITGSLSRLDESNRYLTPKIITNITVEINRIRAIRRIRFEFDNWSFDTGNWMPVNRESPGSQSFANR